MKFALVDGIKQEPAPKLKGICCNCGSITQAKCGTRKVWHWSHVTLQKCDPWWESETEWHRLWKGYFPCQNQEVIHFDDKTGEKHIADIKTNNGMIMEIQNSPIDELEMLSREHFYGKMMWIVNGEKFKNNFTVLGKLPDPKSKIAQEVFFMQPTSRYVEDRRRKAELSNERDKLIADFGSSYLRSEDQQYTECLKAVDWGIFYLRSKDRQYTEFLKSGDSYEEWFKSRDTSDISSMELIEFPSMEEKIRVSKEVQSHYVGHHLFIWKNHRNVWFQSAKPVFVDFGGSDLWRLMDYDLRGLKCVRKISKTALIEKNGGCYFSSTDDVIALAPANHSVAAD